MPLIELHGNKLILLIVLLAPAIQIAGAIIATHTPESRLTMNSWLFKEREFEKKGFYRRVFKVHKWKKYLPDGAKYFKGDFTKKNLLSYDVEYIEKFIVESCRAELVHWLGMAPFVVFFLLTPPYIAIGLIIYSIIVNAPCIIAQRYNRPRLKLLLKKFLYPRQAIEEESMPEGAKA